MVKEKRYPIYVSIIRLEKNNSRVGKSIVRKFKSSIGVIFVSLLLHVFLYNSEHIKKFDYEFYDFISMLSHKIESHDDDFYTVIVDIDEKSLNELGQWPWPRVIDAQLIDTLNGMTPSAIGVDILFSEEDRVSPINIEKFYKDFFDLNLSFSQLPDAYRDNDKLFADAINELDTTVGIYLDNRRYATASHCQDISYRENIFSEITPKLNSSYLLCNHPIIQKGVKNFGFLNAWEDSDGIFRRISLFMGYRKEVFPSFALATLLSVDPDIKIDKTSDTILVNFFNKKPKVFSAVDILTNKIPAREIQGKIVILGSSVVGFDSAYTRANNEKISSNLINAFVIDNILTNSFLIQPEVYKKVNLLLSFLLSIVVIFLLVYRKYIYIVTIFLLFIVLSLAWLVDFYIKGVYLSVGYLWVPFLYFSIAMLMYHLRIINNEKQQQEKFLIRQNKLASMGEMISLIAHQWRQPLSAINGIVLNLDIDYRKKTLTDERLDRHLNKIEETTAYLSKTISDFTDFFSTNKKDDRFYLADIIRQAQQLTGISNQNQVQVTYREDRPIEVIGHKSELLQSILIILNNAIYASTKNLSATGQGKIFITPYLLNDRLFLPIEDNGGGIDLKDVKKIFTPYFTTKEKAHGTGLGLYILKMLVEDSMNGKVTVENGEEGARFIIQIPLNQERG